MKRILFFIALMLLLVAGVFIYTIRAPQPQALKLFLPKGTEKDTFHVTKPDEALTVILTQNDMIYYYSGELEKSAVIEKTDFKGIREILLARKNQHGNHLIVVIKGDAQSSYKNTVDMLDEMAINDIKRYALVDLTEAEADRLGLKTTSTVQD